MKTFKIIGWTFGALAGIAAIVLAILSSVFSYSIFDYVALGLLVLAILLEIVASIVEINPKKDESEGNAEPSEINGTDEKF